MPMTNINANIISRSIGPHFHLPVCYLYRTSGFFFVSDSPSSCFLDKGIDAADVQIPDEHYREKNYRYCHYQS